MKYSATSVMLPDLSVVEICRLLQKQGYEGVEWRVRYTRDDLIGKGFSFWGEHKSDLSPDNLLAKAAEVKRITEDHGLAMPLIASNLLANESDKIEKLAEGVAKLGPIPIRLGAPRPYDRTVNYHELYKEALDAYAAALEIIKPYGLKIIIEIHGGTIMVSASLAYRIASRFSPSEMGVIYDINNMAKDGFETFRMGMELLGDYMQHCHAGGWRPVEGQRHENGTLDWGYEGCDLAESIMDVPLFLSDLKAVDYQGFVSIEDFRPIDPEAKLEAQIDYLLAAE